MYMVYEPATKLLYVLGNVVVYDALPNFTLYVAPEPPVGLDTVILPVPPLHDGLTEDVVADGDEVDNVTLLDDAVEHKLVSLTSIVYVPVVKLLNVLLDPHCTPPFLEYW